MVCLTESSAKQYVISPQTHHLFLSKVGLFVSISFCPTADKFLPFCGAREPISLDLDTPDPASSGKT